MIQKRNPLHFAAMNKAVHSQKTLEALLNIDFETVPGWDNFLKLHDQLQGFEDSDEHFDPRKSNGILKQFRELLEPKIYASVVRDFKQQVNLLLKEALNQQDFNYHSPLHVASYFGAYQSTRLLTKLGSEPHSAAFPQKPLEIGKDKYTRDVLQNLNNAAT